MPVLTALRRVGPGRVQLEVDGRRWRTVSDDVVVRAGLAAGLELDRPTLRRIRGELGRARAQGVAARALARRDLSRQELESRLARAHVGDETAAEVVEGLAGVGAVDDERVARTRAEALAARGWGDAALMARLEGFGLDERRVRDAVARLEPEPVRARRVAGREPDLRRAARLLARRGFAPDTIEEVLGAPWTETGAEG